MKDKVALFDFCETLTSFQTGNRYIDFVRQESKNKKMKRKQKLLNFLTKYKIIKFLQKRNTKNYVDKVLILWQLKGFSSVELEHYAKKYYENIVKPGLIPLILNEMLVLKKNGYKIYIVSGGYEIYIKYFVQDFELDGVIATKILFKDGVCEGVFDGPDCMKEAKIDYLNSFFDKDKIDFDSTIAYSDSWTDLPLLKWCNKGVVVSKTAQFWAKENNMEEILWD